MLPKIERERMFNEGMKSVAWKTIEVRHPSLMNGIRNFFVERQPCGDFLMAVFRNDLMEAVGRADNISMSLFQELASFVYNYTPHNSHGSPEVVRQWLIEDEPSDD